MNVQEALNSLNPQQLEAALYEDGPCLIVAGAGTGKTFCAIGYLMYLLDKRKIDKIILFTNT